MSLIFDLILFAIWAYITIKVYALGVRCGASDAVERLESLNIVKIDDQGNIIPNKDYRPDA